MIVWGGREGGFLNPVTRTGGRYDPATNSWRETSMVTAPAGRCLHVAAWDGNEMIVWGGTGSSGVLGDGARYDPDGDRWRPMNPTGAPSPRALPTAIWTGNEMLVWGGGSDFGVLNSGARYVPSADAWLPMAPAGDLGGRWSYTTVWTGQEMIIWGGYLRGWATNTGGRYRPETDSWTPTNSGDAPGSVTAHVAVWTGEEMIVWGGFGNAREVNSGGRYRPDSDSWVPTGGVTPIPRADHSTVWTGSEMIVWGGTDQDSRRLDSGGRYDPAIDDWLPTTTEGAPFPRDRHAAVWTGSEMIVWGGSYWDGGKYDPATDSWTSMSTDRSPTHRWDPTVVWTGTEMILWGGGDYDTGGRYNPRTDTWRPTRTDGAPLPRSGHAAVWTGNNMIVWGGSNLNDGLNSGARYDPESDSWRAISATSAPVGRFGHAAVWTGQEMIVWGGRLPGFQGDTATGGRYDAESDTWRVTTGEHAPFRRAFHAAVWTGREMIIWGGGQPYQPGGRYDPVSDSWREVGTLGAPRVRHVRTLAWTGNEVVVWGGLTYPNPRNDGGRYCARSNRPPTANAGTDGRLECETALHASVVLDGTGSSDPDSTPGTTDDIASFAWIEDIGLPSERDLGTGEAVGVALGLGAHSITLRVTDRSGESSSDQVLVTVVDSTPPNVSVELHPEMLWPPNHRMMSVEASVVASDLCSSPTVVLASVTSNEVDNGEGDGNTVNDIQSAETGTPDYELSLRAERAGGGAGRIYTAVYTAVDGSGNTHSSAGFAVVPHDQGGVTSPIDLTVEQTGSGTLMLWTDAPGAVSYDVIRGSVSSIRENGPVIDLGPVVCIEADSSDTSTAGFEDPAVPAPDAVFFYLVQYDDGTSSSYGSESAAKPRAPGVGGCVLGQGT